MKVCSHLVMVRYIVSYRISRWWGHIVAYPYRDNYPSKKIDIPHNANQECCCQHVELNAVQDINKGSLVEHNERDSN